MSSLDRTTFHTSRQMDFFSQKELITQTGHDVAEWPHVIIKELVDNALDACKTGIVPIINIVADATGISITDNGDGLAAVQWILGCDFPTALSNGRP